MENKKIKIISVVNQKGGCGKTTIARNIGYGLTLKGLKVLLIDTDPQASLSKWSSKKNGEIIPVIQLQKKGTLENCINNISYNYDIIIIDTRSNIDADNKELITVAEVIKASDITLISVLPSEDDFVSSIPIADLIMARKEITNKPEAYYIINKLRKNSQTSKAIIKALENNKNKIPYIKDPIYDRQIYTKTYTSGDTIYHSKEKEAKEAVEECTPIIEKITQLIK
jgi:chromosome partitioning protein